MSDAPRELVILGITKSGATFRPSDWAERLCGCMSLFGEDQRISYSPYLRPVVSQGVRCVVVDTRLEQVNHAAFEFLMGFVRDNGLQMRRGRDEPREPEAALSGGGEGRTP
jgi:hypothetical protein